MQDVRTLAEDFGRATSNKIYLSGLPLYEQSWVHASRIEMRWFLFARSFFPHSYSFSFSALQALSLAVVIIGVVFSMATSTCLAL